MQSEFRRGQTKNHTEDIKVAIKKKFGSARFADTYGPLCFSPHPKKSDLVLNITTVPSDDKNEYHIEQLYRFKPEDKTKKVSLKYIRGDDGEQKKTVIVANSIEELLDKLEKEVGEFERSLISKMTDELQKTINEAILETANSKMVDLKDRFGHEELARFAKHFSDDDLQSVGKKTRAFTDAENQISAESEVAVGLLRQDGVIRDSKDQSHEMKAGYYVLEVGAGIEKRAIGGPWDCPVGAAAFAVEYIQDDDGYPGITSTIDSGISQLMSTGEPEDLQCKESGENTFRDKRMDQKIEDKKIHRASEHLEEAVYQEILAILQEGLYADSLEDTYGSLSSKTAPVSGGLDQAMKDIKSQRPEGGDENALPNLQVINAAKMTKDPKIQDMIIANYVSEMKKKDPSMSDLDMKELTANLTAAVRSDTL